MVETPSIVYEIAKLKGVVDFISVGTNDLSQYLFASDRMNPNLGAMLNPWQPALIASLNQIAIESKKPVFTREFVGKAALTQPFQLC